MNFTVVSDGLKGLVGVGSVETWSLESEFGNAAAMACFNIEACCEPPLRKVSETLADREETKPTETNPREATAIAG